MQRFTIIFFIQIFFIAVQAQYLPFHNYTTDDGLPSNAIKDIIQDKLGYIWFATQSGLSKFDGNTFKNYTVKDGLQNNELNTLFVDSKNNLWIGSRAGVSMYDGKKFKIYNEQSGLINNVVYHIFEDKYQSIWIGTGNGCSRILQDGRLVNYTLEGTINDNHIVSFYLDSTNLWLGTFDGILQLEYSYDSVIFKNTWLNNRTICTIISSNKKNLLAASQENGIFLINKTNKKEKLLPNTNLFIILDIIQDKNNNLYIGTYLNGIIKYDFISNTFVTIKGSEDKSYNKLILDKCNSVYGIFNGLFIIGSEFIHLTTKNNLTHDNVISIFEDKESNIWLGTEEGVSKLSTPFIIYNSKSMGSKGFSEEDVLSIYADDSDDVFIGTVNGLYNLTPINQIKKIEIGRDAFNEIYSIYKSSDNVYWIGTKNGVTTYANGNLTVYYDSIWYTQMNPDNWPNDIIEDKKGTIWFAHQRGLSKIIDSKQYNYSTDQIKLPDNYIYALEVDSINRIWCATENGVAIFDNNRISKIFNKDNGLSNNICNDIVIDTMSNVWIATDNGLNKISYIYSEETTIQHFNTKNGLRSDILMFVGVSIDNQIFIGHEKGMDILNQKDNSITSYGKEEGLITPNTYLGAISFDKYNNAWIGTSHGFVKYMPVLDKKSNQSPKLYIISIHFFGFEDDIYKYASSKDKNTGLPLKLKLPYNKNDLVFSYVALHFKNPQKNRVQYMLEGFDKNWREPTGDQKTTPYQKLSHGYYTFKIRAVSSDGVWTKQPVEYSFFIKPPFWKTRIAILFEVLLGLVLLYLIIKLRERKLQHDKKVLADKVKERTVEIEKQKDQIEHQNKEIKDSILYAKRIQTAVLPGDELCQKLLPDYFILFRPRDIVSGDFYWLTEKKGKIYVVASDCTGHGVPGAFMSMLGVSLLNEIISKEESLSAAKILEQLRANVKRTLSQTGKRDEAKDGMDLALCILDLKQMKAQFAGAYNPIWIIRNKELEVFKGDKMPIGIHYIGREKAFNQHDINIQKNDLIYMFSDGYADQFGGPDDKKFKSATLKELLLEIHQLPLYRQKDILDKRIEEWKGDRQQVDDIMLIGIKIM